MACKAASPRHGFRYTPAQQTPLRPPTLAPAEWLSEWEGFQAKADEFRELDAERVLAFGRMSGRGRMSGVVGDTEIVNLFHIQDNKVTRLVLYSNRERAFADLGLAPQARSPDA